MATRFPRLTDHQAAALVDGLTPSEVRDLAVAEAEERGFKPTDRRVAARVKRLLQGRKPDSPQVELEEKIPEPQEPEPQEPEPQEPEPQEPEPRVKVCRQSAQGRAHLKRMREAKKLASPQNPET